jgi:hypothetical protein
MEHILTPCTRFGILYRTILKRRWESRSSLAHEGNESAGVETLVSNDSSSCLCCDSPSFARSSVCHQRNSDLEDLERGCYSVADASCPFMNPELLEQEHSETHSPARAEGVGTCQYASRRCQAWHSRDSTLPIDIVNLALSLFRRVIVYAEARSRHDRKGICFGS